MKSGIFKAWWIVVLFVAVILVAGFYSAMFLLTEQEGLPDGVTIDGVYVGSKSQEEAQVLLESAFADRISGLGIQVHCQGKSRFFAIEEAGAKLESGKVFKTLEEMVQGGLFEEADSRLETQQGWEANSEVSFSKTTLLTAVKNFADTIAYAPTDATVHFDRKGEFFFTETKDGLAVDAQALCDQLYEQFVKEDYNDIQFEAYAVKPALTKELLMKHTKLLGTYTTVIAGSNERITNICMITDTVNGQTIMPGETLSLNELTGERTSDKGYKEAPAIRYGELIEEIGGGICQLSGTLFAAALLSDLEIVERHHHTWPSDYLPVGMDATITWPNKDLKLLNRSEWPAYIHAVVEGDQLIVTIYGEMRDEGLTIKLENDIYEILPPPQPILIDDDTRPIGYKRTMQNERKGYRVRLYRNYYRGDELVEHELVHTDRFAPIAGKYVVGTKIEEIPIVPEEK